MAGGKISVELRLVLDKLNADIKAAAASMRAGLSKDMGSTAAGTEKAANAQTKLAGEVKKTTNALKDQAKAAYEAWKASLPPMRVTDSTQQRKGSGRFFSPWSTDAGGGLATDPDAIINPQRPKAAPGAIPPAMFRRPGSIPPPIPPAKMGMLQQALKAIDPILFKAALIGAALAGLRVALGYVTFAFRGMLVPIRLLSRTFIEAAESARRMYAKALQSGGLGMGYVARRAALADVIGVGEEEVYSYGNAVRHLNERLNFATAVAAYTNKELTSASWALRVVAHDFAALKSLLAAQLAPVVRELAAAFHGIAMVLSGEAIKWGKIIASGIRAGLLQVLGPFWSSALLGAQVIGGGDKGAAPGTEVATKRMPFSAWEKMGLVVGTGGGNNWAQQTAQATKKTAENTARLIELMTGKNGQLMIPFTLHNAP